MAEPSSVSVVIPAYNKRSHRRGRHCLWRPQVRGTRSVVDDGPRTARVRAKSAGATVAAPIARKGTARQSSGHHTSTVRHVLIVDGDGQHPGEDAVRLTERLGECDLVIGARSVSTQATQLRRFGNAASTVLASHLSGRRFRPPQDSRARREYLREFIHLLPNGFSTPTTTTLAFIKAGYNVSFGRSTPGSAWAPRRSSSRDGVRFLLIILRIITLFSPFRVFLPISLASFLVVAGYAVWTIATQSHVTNSSVLLIMLAVIVFLVGLVSEQISALRFEGRQ